MYPPLKTAHKQNGKAVFSVILMKKAIIAFFNSIS